MQKIEAIDTPGVLAISTYELLYQIEVQPMTMSYKMLLLMFMTDLADGAGRANLRTLAERFQEFFVARSLQNKVEENPNRPLPSGGLAGTLTNGSESSGLNRYGTWASHL